jgi:23S rRNA (adenine-N6)-dimethyltransferase
VAAAEIRPGEVVVDIGAGHGALTEPLLAAGARVFAVELHERRAEKLRRTVADRDAAVLTLDFRAFRWPGRPVRVVANPPFALASELVRVLLRHPQLTAADLVLPRVVVTRLVGDAARAGRRLQARRGLNLPRSAFRPRPPVDCGVLQVRRRSAGR